jgi:hypothetical protein
MVCPRGDGGRSHFDRDGVSDRPKDGLWRVVKIRAFGASDVDRKRMALLPSRAMSWTRKSKASLPPPIPARSEPSLRANGQILDWLLFANDRSQNGDDRGGDRVSLMLGHHLPVQFARGWPRPPRWHDQSLAQVFTQLGTEEASAPKFGARAPQSECDHSRPRLIVRAQKR